MAEYQKTFVAKLRTYPKSGYRPKTAQARQVKPKVLKKVTPITQALKDAQRAYGAAKSVERELQPEKAERGGGNGVKRMGAGLDNKKTFPEQ